MVRQLALSLVAFVIVASVRGADANDPREAEVRKFIDRYFLTWSNQDLDRYGQCFHPRAVIQLLEPDGALATMPLGPFLQSQREAHRQAANRLSETAEKVEIRFEGRIARAVVYWKLVGGEAPQFGYDHFTLIEVGDRWQIANLLFYAEANEGEEKQTSSEEQPAVKTP